MLLLNTALLLGAAALALAEDVWTFPPLGGATGEFVSNLGFTVGQDITLTWKSSSSVVVDIWLMQDNGTAMPGNGGCMFQSAATCARIKTVDNTGSTPWKVSRLGMTNNGNIYYIAAFNITNPTNVASDFHFNAHYFNITDTPKSSSVAPSSTTASATTKTPPPSVSGASTTSTSNTPTSGAGANSGSKSGTNLAVAVGAGVGVPLGLIAIVAGVWVILHHRRKTKESMPILSPQMGSYSAGPPSMIGSSTAAYYKPDPSVIHELSDYSTQTHELPGNPKSPTR